MERKRITSLRNSRGIKIKRCCASCCYKEVDNDGRRVCQLMQLVVPIRFRCSNWALKATYLSAGNGGGRVKCREYLMYVRDKRLEEQVLIEQGVITPEQQISCRELRRKFNKEYGKSVYALR